MRVERRSRLSVHCWDSGRGVRGKGRGTPKKSAGESRTGSTGKEGVGAGADNVGWVVDDFFTKGEQSLQQRSHVALQSVQLSPADHATGGVSPGKETFRGHKHLSHLKGRGACETELQV